MPGRRKRYIRILKNKARSMSGTRGSGADPTPWVADTVLRGLGTLSERGGSALLVYGSDDEFYAHFREAASGPLGRLADSEAVQVDVDVVGRLHGYPSVDVQEAFVSKAGTWLRESERR